MEGNLETGRCPPLSRGVPRGSIYRVLQLAGDGKRPSPARSSQSTYVLEFANISVAKGKAKDSLPSAGIQRIL